MASYSNLNDLSVKSIRYFRFSYYPTLILTKGGKVKLTKGNRYLLSPNMCQE